MKRAQIENGIVINVILVDPANIPHWCKDWPVCVDAGPGWTYQDGVFSPPDEAQADA